MLSRTNLQLSQVTTSTPRSPLISDLRRRAEALQGQITDARSKITGTDASLVPKITAFDMLELQRQFADKQLASATSSLEAARLQSERQQLYLETIVRPNVSDYPAYPKRLASIAVRVRLPLRCVHRCNIGHLWCAGTPDRLMALRVSGFAV